MTGVDGVGRVVVGASASATHAVFTADVDGFAQLTDDSNPIHLDADYVATTRFGRRIAHGMLTAGYISAILDTRLPGPGSIYVSQTLNFAVPVYLGDSITATVTIEEVRQDKPIVTARTECVNQEGTIVVSGNATLFCGDLPDWSPPS